MTPPIVFMRFKPAWGYIEGICQFGRFFCQTTFGLPELAERAGVVLQETLANAIKYSSSDPESELELEISARDDAIEIAVSSIPDPVHLESLREELELLRQLDPRHDSAVVPRPSTDCGAVQPGLARVRYEHGVELSMEEELGGRVRITAVSRL